MNPNYPSLIKILKTAQPPKPCSFRYHELDPETGALLLSTVLLISGGHRCHRLVSTPNGTHSPLNTSPFIAYRQVIMASQGQCAFQFQKIQNTLTNNEAVRPLCVSLNVPTEVKEA